MNVVGPGPTESHDCERAGRGAAGADPIDPARQHGASGGGKDGYAVPAEQRGEFRRKRRSAHCRRDAASTAFR